MRTETRSGEEHGSYCCGVLTASEVDRFHPSLGVAYHFKREIEEALKVMYQTNSTMLLDIHYDLTIVSLLFRLLRQEGYHIPSGN